MSLEKPTRAGLALRFLGPRNIETAIAGTGFTALGVVLLVVGILLGNLVVAMMGTLCAAAAVTITLWYGGRQRRAAAADLSAAFQEELKKHGLKRFCLEEAAVGFHPEDPVVQEAAESLYGEMVGKALADLVITEKEQSILLQLRDKLQLDSGRAERIEAGLRRSRYAKEVSSRLADGVLDKKEAAQLHRIRASLGLSDAEGLQAARTDIADTYRATFRRFIEDGVLSQQELHELQRFRDATGLSAAEAAKITGKDAIDLYRRTVSMICQDGEVTSDEIARLDGLQQLLGLSHEDVAELKKHVKRVQCLAEIRAGKLPTRSTDLKLRNSEICHYKSPCVFEWETATQFRQVSGSLCVTNQRLIFQSDMKSFESKIKRIINIRHYSNAVLLGMTSSRGQGIYRVKDPELLNAVLEGVIRYTNRVVSEQLDATRTRRIPEDVRLEVWQRDGGKCSRCSATEYLEFDHIIPYSKGGSNSGKNVQLLCRRCNLSKGADIV